MSVVEGIRYTLASPDNENEFRTLAAKALGSRLYVSGWMMSLELAAIKQGRELVAGQAICLAEDVEVEVPVGVCLLVRKRPNLDAVEPMSMTFVRKSRRREGIGRHMLTLALGDPDRTFYRGQGVEAAEMFFERFDNSVYTSRF